jgi:hypothetical protein
MAKNFKYYEDIKHMCIDDCSRTPYKIGSLGCATCTYNKGIKQDDTVSCPKIIYRSPITGLVIMRKK